MKTIRFSEIQWDTDGQYIRLPKQVTLEVESTVDLEQEGADILSDKFGWCVYGFEYMEVAK